MASALVVTASASPATASTAPLTDAPAADCNGTEPSSGADTFAPMSPPGCCRTVSGGFGSYETLNDTDVAECEASCRAMPECLGYEFHGPTAQCELHLDAADFDHTYPGNPAETCVCVRRGPHPAASAPAAYRFVELRTPDSGCCRTVDGGSGTSDHVAGVADREACEELCRADRTCAGVEHHDWDGLCELHRDAADFNHTVAADAGNCTCVAREDVEAEEEEGGRHHGCSEFVSQPTSPVSTPQTGPCLTIACANGGTCVASDAVEGDDGGSGTVQGVDWSCDCMLGYEGRLCEARTHAVDFFEPVGGRLPPNTGCCRTELGGFGRSFYAMAIPTRAECAWLCYLQPNHV